MKKMLFVAVLAVLLSSCADKILYSVTAVSVDYSSYAERGFFMTESNSVNFDYQPIGSIYVQTSSGYDSTGIKQPKQKNYMYSSNQYSSSTRIIYNDELRTEAKIKTGPWRSVGFVTAIEVLYKKSIELGADGLINLNRTYVPAQYSKNGGIIYPDKVIITGMAIKRKK